MSNTDTRPSIQVTREFKASPEQVFDAWTQVDQLKKWMCPGEIKTGAVSADPQVNGDYSIEMIHSDGNSTITKGKYLVVDRPHKLVMSWQWQMEGSVESKVTVELKATDNGTELTLTHDLLRDDEAAKQHTHGWEGCLLKLDQQFG